jgi:uncharacterized membrane protein YeaQ/YmgE (transglycosylase-associated protein family)
VIIIPGPAHLITLLLVGLIIGAIASRVVSGRGYGCLADTAIGLAGSFIGGILFYRFFRVGTVLFSATLTDLVVGFIGAVLLLVVVELVGGGRGRRRRL